VILLLLGCATHHAILGQVVDRNGKPVDRANVALAPGNVEIITDDDGHFVIDYARDAEGTRTKLAKRTEYTIEYFKVGYHPEKATFYFKKGELTLEPVTLVADSVRVEVQAVDIDPAKFPDRQTAAGGSYEGE
jgi:hypothetical protein